MLPVKTGARGDPVAIRQSCADSFGTRLVVSGRRKHMPRVGIGLLARCPWRPRISEFVGVAGIQAGDEQFPDARVPRQRNRMAPAIPVVEIANHADTAATAGAHTANWQPVTPSMVFRRAAQHFSRLEMAPSPSRYRSHLAELLREACKGANAVGCAKRPSRPMSCQRIDRMRSTGVPAARVRSETVGAGNGRVMLLPRPPRPLRAAGRRRTDQGAAFGLGMYPEYFERVMMRAGLTA